MIGNHRFPPRLKQLFPAQNFSCYLVPIHGNSIELDTNARPTWQHFKTVYDYKITSTTYTRFKVVIILKILSWDLQNKNCIKKNTIIGWSTFFVVVLLMDSNKDIEGQVFFKSNHEKCRERIFNFLEQPIKVRFCSFHVITTTYLNVYTGVIT